MASRKPIVLVSGQTQEMPSGDTIAGVGYTDTTQSWTAAQVGSVAGLSVASNLVAVDMALANNFSLSLQATTGQTLSNPTNAVAGQSGHISLTQNAVPSALAFGSNWKQIDGAIPTVSTTANAHNLISYYVASPTQINYYLNKFGVA